MKYTIIVLGILFVSQLIDNIRLYRSINEIGKNLHEAKDILGELQKKYDEEREKNQVLAVEQKNIKLYSSLSGNPEHNRLMKNHINRLVKEIDSCIAQLQNSGL